MLIPTMNGQVYYQIYELENWLRRICLTAYMQVFGEDWLNQIPENIKKSTTSVTRNNLNLSYIGGDNDDNVIWTATQGQLIMLFQFEEIKDVMESLINMKRDTFVQKISELKQIRNFLAHNRALSETTSIIVAGIIESLKLAISNFKSKIMYSSRDIIFDPKDDKISVYFENKMKDNDWSKFQAFIESDDYLYGLICLPVSHTDGLYISGYKLLDAYKNFTKVILAFQINKEANEYMILVSKKTDEKKIEDIIDIFVSRPQVWTNKQYIYQNPKYICNPQVWLYENQKPIDE
jgi:hypothetical protein